jgi:hypothetical protein
MGEIVSENPMALVCVPLDCTGNVDVSLKSLHVRIQGAEINIPLNIWSNV